MDRASKGEATAMQKGWNLKRGFVQRMRLGDKCKITLVILIEKFLDRNLIVSRYINAEFVFNFFPLSCEKIFNFQKEFVKEHAVFNEKGLKVKILDLCASI